MGALLRFPINAAMRSIALTIRSVGTDTAGKVLLARSLWALLEELELAIIRPALSECAKQRHFGDVAGAMRANNDSESVLFRFHDGLVLGWLWFGLSAAGNRTLRCPFSPKLLDDMLPLHYTLKVFMPYARREVL